MSLCPGTPSCHSIVFLFLCPFLSCHSPSLIIRMSSAWFYQRWKTGEWEALWITFWVFCPRKLRHYDTYISSAALPFCAHRQGGLCNWTGWDKATILGCLPQRHEAGDALSLGQKRPQKRSTEELANTFALEVWRRQLFMRNWGGGEGHGVHIYPSMFCLFGLRSQWQ